MKKGEYGFYSLQVTSSFCKKAVCLESSAGMVFHGVTVFPSRPLYLLLK